MGIISIVNSNDGDRFLPLFSLPLDHCYQIGFYCISCLEIHWKNSTRAKRRYFSFLRSLLPWSWALIYSIYVSYSKPHSAICSLSSDAARAFRTWYWLFSTSFSALSRDLNLPCISNTGPLRPLFSLASCRENFKFSVLAVISFHFGSMYSTRLFTMSRMREYCDCRKRWMQFYDRTEQYRIELW